MSGLQYPQARWRLTSHVLYILQNSLATILYHGEEPKSERCAVMKIENMQLNLKSDWMSCNFLQELNNYYNAKYAHEHPVQEHGALPSGSSDPPELWCNESISRIQTLRRFSIQNFCLNHTSTFFKLYRTFISGKS